MTQGYRTGGVVLSWIGVILAPILLVMFVVGKVRERKRAKTPPAG